MGLGALKCKTAEEDSSLSTGTEWSTLTEKVSVVQAGTQPVSLIN